jgi:hypothetical protein
LDLRKPSFLKIFISSFLQTGKPGRRSKLQVASLTAVTVAIALGQACGTGFEVNETLLGSLNQGSSLGKNLDLTCKPEMDPQSTPLRRLSKRQYINTMVDLSKGLVSYINRYDGTWYTLQGPLAPVMGILPGDMRAKNSFDTMDQTLSEYHAYSYFFIASSTADFAIENAGWLNSYSGGCLGPVVQGSAVADACIDTFINTLGKVALRKIPSDEDRALFKTLYKDFPSPKDGVAAIVQAMLLHPRFTFLVEADGTPVQGRSDLLQLNDFELAQRLSFFFLARSPSPQMLADAEAGLFTKSEESFKAELAKFFTLPNDGAYDPTKDYNVGIHPVQQTPLEQNFGQFFDQWLEVKKAPGVPEGPVIDVFAHIYNDPDRFSWNHASDTDPYFSNEIYNFTTRLTWFENKKFSDFLTDDSSVLNGGLPTYYGVPAVAGITHLKDRAGYLTRAGFLLTGDEDTHPILRGAFIRRNILCDELPSPNPDALPDRALSPPEANPEWTTRERYANKTASTTCMGCHSQINSLAFAMEDFDSLGRNRHNVFEPVFKTAVSPSGAVSVSIVGKPTNNSSVSGVNFSFNEVIPQINGGIELSQQLAKSPKANMCFARQVFRHTFGRKETSADACMLQDMYANSTASDGSMKRMITNIPLSKHFKLRKLGM